MTNKYKIQRQVPERATFIAPGTRQQRISAARIMAMALLQAMHHELAVACGAMRTDLNARELRTDFQ